MAVVPFVALQTHHSDWDPSRCKVTLNCRLEGRIVPSADGQARLDAAQLVVLDNFFGEAERVGLLEALVGKGRDPTAAPPESKWERNTKDDASAAKTWGLQDDALAGLVAEPPPTILEIQTRLVKLYPQYIVAHMPSAEMQRSPVEGTSNDGTAAEQVRELGDVHARKFEICSQSGQSEACCDEQQQKRTHDIQGVHSAVENEGGESEVDCCNILANAPVHGDHYEWHVDADPLTLPDCVWRRHFGDFSNRSAGKPLLVSLLLYLVDDDWQRNLHAETLFLDSATDVGVVVRPRRFRAVLMDQDVLHRVVAPSRLAGHQPRYSLVWKLAFLPRESEQACSIAKAEWGSAVHLGSAARLEEVKRAFMASEKRKRQASE